MRADVLRRVLPAAAIVLAGTVATGAAWQESHALAERAVLAPAGRLVHVGEGRVHLHCTGPVRRDAPTVVLESGLGLTTSSWAWVQSRLAMRYRTCSWDRPGIGWSDARDGAPHATSATHVLHEALVATGERGPFVLVGHSIGGLAVRAFAHVHGDEVAAVAFLDASHPDQLERLDRAATRAMRVVGVVTRALPMLARIGVTRLTSVPAAQARGLPEGAFLAEAAFASSPAHLAAASAELDAWPSHAGAARALRTLGDRRVLVVTAGETAAATPGWLALQDELARLSTRGAHVVLDGVTHVGLLADRAAAREVAALLAGLAASVEAERRGHDQRGRPAHRPLTPPAPPHP